MKKIILLSILVLMLVVGLCHLKLVQASVCAECDLYTYEIILPYLSSPSSGWWTGVAITNTSDEDVLCRLDYVGDNSVERIDVGSRSVRCFVADIGTVSYAKVRSTVPLFITVMISDNDSMQGYVTQLKPIRAEEE